jgi:hypothetical protein
MEAVTPVNSHYFGRTEPPISGVKNTQVSYERVKKSSILYSGSKVKAPKRCDFPFYPHIHPHNLVLKSA